MRYFNALIVILLLIVTCKQHDSGKSNNDVNNDKDSISKNFQKNNEPVSKSDNDTVLISLSINILKSLKTQDYSRLSEFIHPEFGIRFSPYGNIDTIKDQRLSKKELIRLSRNQKTIKWGIFEGTGEPINLNIRQYFKRFVYDVDFLNAEKKSVNKIIGSITSSNNLQSIYPKCDFTEFYFSGFEPKYEGMDWRALLLVFKTDNNKTYLIAIIHDQWRI